jgi:hypothetical protein
LTQLLALAAPFLAGFIGWLLLWRRNVITYQMSNIHFCGADLFEKEFWAPSKQERQPLIDVFEIRFRNFGLKHLDEAHFLLHYMSTDAVYHPDHGNNIPACNFAFADDKPTVVRVDVKEIPAFEKFGIAILNTHPSRKFLLVGSGRTYRFEPAKKYHRRIVLTSISLIILTAIVFLGLKFRA